MSVPQPATIRLISMRKEPLRQGFALLRRFQCSSDLFNALTRKPPGLHGRRVARFPC